MKISLRSTSKHNDIKRVLLHTIHKKIDTHCVHLEAFLVAYKRNPFQMSYLLSTLLNKYEQFPNPDVLGDTLYTSTFQSTLEHLNPTIFTIPLLF